MSNRDLIEKYNTAGPRYTSYPTVPHWENNLDAQEWKQHVGKAFRASNARDGISVYVHLPYCESLCTYCGCNTRITVNHQVEETYICALLNEWNLYLDVFGRKPVLREIHLGGGTPTFFSPQNLERLISGLTCNAVLHPLHESGFEAHPNNTTLEHLQTLHRLGFRRLSLGIQDFDPAVQKKVNRVQSPERVKKVTEQARKTGYASVNYDLIYGLPYQTAGSVAHTAELTVKLKPDRVAFYSYAHVPWLRPWQKKFPGEVIPSGAAKRSLYELGKRILLQAGYADIGMDHFALPHDALYKARENGSLHRNFMGYTGNYTRLLVGLGASSISDTWTAFLQNMKRVEDYTRVVAEGRFPLSASHSLSSTDLEIRRHILNLMCKGKTTWPKGKAGAASALRAIARLREPEQDGLVRIGSDEISVTPAGEAFLRNICMTFDERLHASRTEGRTFSKTI